MTPLFISSSSRLVLSARDYVGRYSTFDVRRTLNKNSRSAASAIVRSLAGWLLSSSNKSKRSFAPNRLLAMASASSSSSSSDGNSFSYAFIPANEQAPLEQRRGDKSGGLSNDELVATAKTYFYDQSGGATRADALQNAPPDEQRAIAQKIRSQILTGNPNAESQLSKMNDAALLNLVRSTQASPSCEIIAVTVPTRGNKFRAVSMYASDTSSPNLPLNVRATSLLQACGHAPPQHGDERPPGVYGDVFVGRCHDDEVKDVWERVDMTISDVQDPSTAEWCTIARTVGGGGGGGSSGASAAASLSGVMQQSVSSTMDRNDAVTWSQTNDEVQIDLSVAKGTKAKYVKVSFGMNSLKVAVAGQVRLQGTTGGTVNVDECTYTIQDGDKKGEGTRELSVILSKKDTGVVWPYAVQQQQSIT